MGPGPWPWGQRLAPQAAQQLRSDTPGLLDASHSHEDEKLSLEAVERELSRIVGCRLLPIHLPMSALMQIAASIACPVPAEVHYLMKAPLLLTAPAQVTMLAIPMTPIRVMAIQYAVEVALHRLAKGFGNPPGNIKATRLKLYLRGGCVRFARGV